MLFHKSCSKWPPCNSEHIFKRLIKLPKVRWHMSGVTVATTRLISALRSARVSGGLAYTLFFRWPHKNKSKGLRSGQCGAQLKSVLREMARWPKFSRSISRVAVIVWGVAPSCWNHSNLISTSSLFKAATNFFTTGR